MSNVDEFSIRLSFLTHPTDRAKAEQAAARIRAYAEKLAAVSHTYEYEVASLDDEDYELDG